MTIDKLRNYRNWIGVPAERIYFAVLAAGGWKAVFPQKVPRWASKVRNYFNVAPTSLKRLAEDDAKRLTKQVQRFAFLLDCHSTQTFNRYKRDYRPNARGELNPPPFKVHPNCPAKASKEVVHTSATDRVAVNNALVGEVYEDETKRLWYQMAAGSTIYHWGKEPRRPTFEAIYVDKIRGQDDTPVFKLISPDNTGGSREIIIKNNGGDVIGAVDKKVSTRKLLDCDPAYQGSYNFSETAQVGIAAHKLRDVDTHVAGRFFYVNPFDPFAPLPARCFPAKDLQGKPLADQG